MAGRPELGVGGGVRLYPMPVAEFFAQHDASELCVNTWCNLDFPLAEKWGGRLSRTGTIAMGKERCDFRWRAAKASG